MDNPETSFVKEIRNLQQFKKVISERPEIVDADHIRNAAQTISQRGAVNLDRFGTVPVEVIGENYREGLLAMGVPLRSLALLDLLDQHLADKGAAKVFCMEGLTQFAKLLAEAYPNAICSEYAPDDADQKRIAPIPHVDITDMQFDDNSFDGIISGDVFEHVPDLDRAISECFRVLAKGGALIASFPFAAGNEETILKATLENGVVKHLAEPEYHGDPVRPDEGTLVFQIPAWDIIKTCDEIGFSQASMVYLHDVKKGYLATHLDGLFILKAVK